MKVFAKRATLTLLAAACFALSLSGYLMSNGMQPFGAHVTGFVHCRLDTLSVTYPILLSLFYPDHEKVAHWN